MRHFLVLLLVVWVLVPLANTQASGVAVKPSNLEIKSGIGQQARTDFLVVNIDSAPAIYIIKADSYGRFMTIKPESFQLEPGENRLVTVKVLSIIPYKFQTNISVVSRDLGADSLSALAGVKVPLAITVMPDWRQWLGILCFLIIVGWFRYRYQKKTR